MNLAEYQAKKQMLADEAKRFSFIKAGCQQCKHFDFGKCAANDRAEIPPEFIAVVEECESWEHDDVPF